MKWKTIAIPIVIGVTLCACATAQPTPVPVTGNTAALAGKWEGEFVSNDGTERGTIVFDLQAGKDTAYGDVLMVPREWRGLHNPWERERAEHAHPELVAIRFVNIMGNTIRGTLEPQRDPVCGCTLRTVFDGTLRGDAIDGIYRTTHLNTGETRDGTWKVRRSAVYADARIDRDHAVGKAQ
ncbi:MAG TPA: hypothetical protein VGD27_10610 [Longimicrobiales bacterium]